MKRIKRLLLNVWRFIRLFFHFGKPAFGELEVCDLLVEQKPLLLIGWRNSSRYSIHIKAARFHNYRREGVHILKLPAGLNELNITLRSGWRKTKYKVRLLSLAAPPELLAELITNPARIKLPAVKDFKVAPAVNFDLYVPKIASTVSALQTSFPSVKIQIFHYKQP